MPKVLNAVRSFLSLAVLAIIVAGLVADEKSKEPEKKPLALAEIKKQIQKHVSQKTGRAIAGTSVPKGDPSIWAWEVYEAVPKQDKKILYGWVGEHLSVADKRYLNSKEAAERHKGLGMAYEACQCATSRLQDGALAEKIAGNRSPGK